MSKTYVYHEVVEVAIEVDDDGTIVSIGRPRMADESPFSSYDGDVWCPDDEEWMHSSPADRTTDRHGAIAACYTIADWLNGLDNVHHIMLEPFEWSADTPQDISQLLCERFGYRFPADEVEMDEAREAAPDTWRSEYVSQGMPL